MVKNVAIEDFFPARWFNDGTNSGTRKTNTLTKQQLIVLGHKTKESLEKGTNEEPSVPERLMNLTVLKK